MSTSSTKFGRINMDNMEYEATQSPCYMHLYAYVRVNTLVCNVDDRFNGK